MSILISASLTNPTISLPKKTRAPYPILLTANGGLGHHGRHILVAHTSLIRRSTSPTSDEAAPDDDVLPPFAVSGALTQEAAFVVPTASGVIRMAIGGIATMRQGG